MTRSDTHHELRKPNKWFGLKISSMNDIESQIFTTSSIVCSSAIKCHNNAECIDGAKNRTNV